MASARFSKGSEEWMMFVDFWAICQKYWVPEKDEIYWDGLVEEAGVFCEKFKTIELAAPLMLSFVNTQEKLLKKKN